MPISLVGLGGSAATEKAGGGSTLTLPYPASGIAAGHVAFFFASSNSAATMGDTNGWHVAVSHSGGPADSVVPNINLFWRVMVGTENGTNATITLPSTAVAIGRISVFSGVYAASPLDGAPSISFIDQTTSNANHVLPALTPTVDGCMLLAAGALNSTAAAINTIAGAGFTIWGNRVSGTRSAGAGYQILTTGGGSSTGTKTVAWSTSQRGEAVMIVIHPAPNAGSASGTHTWTGSATSHTAHAGAASGSYAFTGTATGASTHSGAASGSYSFTGAATSVNPHQGTATGAYAFTGAATGAIDHEGSATGTHHWTGGATGHRPTIAASEGQASGSYAWTGGATGDTPANAGAASGSYAWIGDATGQSTHGGAVSGSYTFTGTAVGDQPPNHGEVSGTYTWGGAATAHVSHQGQVTGSYAWAGGASGYRDTGYRGAHNPRGVPVHNPAWAKIKANTAVAVLVRNQAGGVAMDSYAAGDTDPPFTCTLYDGQAIHDATGASSVQVKIWRDDTILVDRPATTVNPDGTVTCDWEAGETDEPGPLYSRVIVTRGVKVQSFPPKDYMVTKIHPNHP